MKKSLFSIEILNLVAVFILLVFVFLQSNKLSGINHEISEINKRLDQNIALDISYQDSLCKDKLSNTVFEDSEKIDFVFYSPDKSKCLVVTTSEQSVAFLGGGVIRSRNIKDIERYEDVFSVFINNEGTWMEEYLREYRTLSERHGSELRESLEVAW